MNKRIKKKKGLSKITKEEVMDLDITLAKYILPRLIKYKTLKINSSCPSCPKDINIKEWESILNEMISSFEIIVYCNTYIENLNIDSKQWNKYRKGMNLFAKYYHCLWD